VNDYAADYVTRKSYQNGAAGLPVENAMVHPAEDVEFTAQLSTNTTAESQTKGHSVVKFILMGIELVPLFAAASCYQYLPGEISSSVIDARTLLHN